MPSVLCSVLFCLPLQTNLGFQPPKPDPFHGSHCIHLLDAHHMVPVFYTRYPFPGLPTYLCSSITSHNICFRRGGFHRIQPGNRGRCCEFRARMLSVKPGYQSRADSVFLRLNTSRNQVFLTTEWPNEGDNEGLVLLAD